jgi:hypothetical protein
LEIRIGIQHSPRELSFETGETPEQLQKTLSAALESGSSLVSLADAKGVTDLIPVGSISYVEIGSDTSRRVGFVN